MKVRVFENDAQLAAALRLGFDGVGTSPSTEGSHIAIADTWSATQLIAAHDDELKRRPLTPEDLEVFANNSYRGNVTWLASRLKPETAARNIRKAFEH